MPNNFSHNPVTTAESRRERAKKRAARIEAVKTLNRTRDAFKFLDEYGPLTFAIIVGALFFGVTLLIMNNVVFAAIHGLGGIYAFGAEMFSLVVTIAFGAIGLAVGEGLAQWATHKIAAPLYVTAYVSATSLGFNTTIEEDRLYAKALRPLLPDALADLGPESQKHVCSTRSSAPTHAAATLPSTEAANQRLHLIP